ncbi:MAG: hypothetical protein LBQ60_00840 [Bacteroidales bacterium]|nr:hypothetical protein [Bacteroidales bacterium]
MHRNLFMHQENTYSKRDRIISYWLMIIFVCFSFSAFSFSTQDFENGHPAHALIDLPGNLSVNFMYHTSAIKYDFGNHRNMDGFPFDSFALYSSVLNQFYQHALKQSTEDFFPLSTIPVYLLERILRI